MQPQKPRSCELWSKQPAIKYKKSKQKKFKQVYEEEDQKSQDSLYSEKKCKETKVVHKQSVKLGMKNKVVWSRESATKSSLCNDRNCQSTRCYKMQSTKKM